METHRNQPTRESHFPHLSLEKKGTDCVVRTEIALLNCKLPGQGLHL